MQSVNPDMQLCEHARLGKPAYFGDKYVNVAGCQYNVIYWVAEVAVIELFCLVSGRLFLRADTNFVCL